MRLRESVCVSVRERVLCTCDFARELMMCAYEFVTHTFVAGVHLLQVLVLFV